MYGVVGLLEMRQSYKAEPFRPSLPYKYRPLCSLGGGDVVKMS